MIEYRNNIDGLTENDIANGFFDGWPNPPSKKTHLLILKRASKVVLAIDNKTGKLIGFVNAISDGVISAYIPLLEVIEKYKHQGIGSELVNRMMISLDGIYMIDIVCNEDLKSFYERFGFTKFNAMVKRNYDNQSGLSLE